MDFLFDELATGRRVKTLTVVDDCSKESVQIIADTSIPALYVTRVLDQIKGERGLPKVIRTDNVLTARGENPKSNSIRYRGALAARRYKRASSSTSCLPRSTGSLAEHSGNKIRRGACRVAFNVPQTA